MIQLRNRANQGENGVNALLSGNRREPVAFDAFFHTILQTLTLGVCWQRYGVGESCWVNESFARLAGQSGATFASARFFDGSIFLDDLPAYLAGIARLQTERIDRLTLELRCSDGEGFRWRELTMQAFRSSDETLSDLVLTLADISDRRQLQEDMQRAIESAETLSQQIENAIGRAQQSAVEANLDNVVTLQLAVHDELTGLLNRRGYNARHPAVIQQIESTDASGYLCYFDLDRFKQINDELGHVKGDQALVEFASILRAVFDNDSLLVRLGGDEFVAMGIVRCAGQIEEVLGALGRLLSARNSKFSGGFNLEASAGVTYFNRAGPHSMEDLTLAADAALYKNKDSRRRSRAASLTVSSSSSEKF